MEHLNIHFLTGPNKGKKFELKKGLILTRNNKKKGDILIEDSKASNPHAEIIKKKAKFYLKDMDSKNGTYFKGEINDLFALVPGVIFQIGESKFEVKKAPPPKKPWNEILAEELKNKTIKDDIKNLEIIKPALILKFRSGPQKGDKWYIHYGPREVGTGSLDLPILDFKAPDICFSLKPSKKKSVLFKTLYPEKVLLNKKHISKKKLVNGDLISFNNTLIEISYED